MLFRKAENKRKAMVIRRRLPMHFERNISSRQVGDDDSVGVGDAARVHEKEREGDCTSVAMQQWKVK